ncbi:unnamed protein product [Rangifer tarandus platyrhynchus]|uniref:Uncharacterized protein n=1 Tax=Rangifer tarandus platyrhynchus TaxID=3082113 RepID=A0AC59ZDG2_RANTA
MTGRSQEKPPEPGPHLNHLLQKSRCGNPFQNQEVGTYHVREYVRSLGAEVMMVERQEALRAQDAYAAMAS